MTKLYEMTAVEMLEAMDCGKATSREICESCLDRIEACEDKLHALLHVADRASVIAQAEAIDAARARGEKLGPLAGVPVLVKDCICTKDMPTTCASKILEDWVPPYDATVVTLLKEAGAISLGKTNMDEFAMGGSTENSAYCKTANPHDLSRVPGGSSGGSAAAVAAGYAPIALGTDTGGSIRQPAAFCGILGMKPTYGQVSRFGLAAYASSLDQIGAFARTSQDLALALSVICKHDVNDSTSVDRPAPDFSLKPQDLKGRKIGVLALPSEAGIDEEVIANFEEAKDDLRARGAEVVEVSLPKALKYGLACYYVLAPAEASSNLARYDGVRYGKADADAKTLIDLYTRTRQKLFGAEVKRRILTGTYVLSSGFYDAYYLTAQKVRRAIAEELADAFTKVEALLVPGAPTPAYKLGAVSDPMESYMADLFTIFVNLAGLPGVTYTSGRTKEGLPLGIQLIGPRFSDAELLNLAATLGAEHENTIAKGVC